MGRKNRKPNKRKNKNYHKQQNNIKYNQNYKTIPKTPRMKVVDISILINNTRTITWDIYNDEIHSDI